MKFCFVMTIVSIITDIFIYEIAGELSSTDFLLSMILALLYTREVVLEKK